MTAIDAKYQQLIQANPWIGTPTGPEQVCQDGKGRFRDYQSPTFRVLRYGSVFFIPWF